MILGIGTDITDIARVGKLFEKKTAAEKILTANEQRIYQTQPNKAQWAAGRFAAKEAAAKAIKAGIAKCPLNCVEVLADENGAPTLEFVGEARKLLPEKYKAHVSVSHDAGVAIAYVTIEVFEPLVEVKDLKSAEMIANLLPETDENAHKGDMGRIAILAGSKRYTGAGYLSALGAIKAGAGLVTWCTNYKSAVSPPEAMNLVLPKIYALRKFISFCRDMDAVVIGPGLGVKFAKRVMRRTAGKISCPIVLDADALNALSAMKNPPRLNAHTVITPHVGEAARLLYKSSEYVAQNTILCAKELAERFGCIVVLKCHNTVVCSPDSGVFINTTGNAGMATGGSGDVLSGIVGALLKRLSPFDAARYGVYLHGLAGDIAALSLGENSIAASDIASNISSAYMTLERYRK